MNREQLFAPVLDWLDAGAPHTQGFGFNMSYFNATFGGYEDHNQTPCGAVCCIAGALAQFNPEIPDQHITDVAEYLGMTSDEFEALFHAYDLEDGEVTTSHYYDDITPAVAADAIRQFLATGQIKWKVE